MADLDQVRALLPDTFSGLPAMRGRLHRWRDTDLGMAAVGRTTIVSGWVGALAERAPRTGRTEESSLIFLVAPPDRWRIEGTRLRAAGPGSPCPEVLIGNRSEEWHVVRQGRWQGFDVTVRTIQPGIRLTPLSPVMEPSWLLGGRELRLSSASSGPGTVAVSAGPPPSSDPDVPPPFTGASRIEVLVDARLGFLHSVLAYLDEAPLARYRLSDLTFDPPWSEEDFRPPVPVGTLVNDFDAANRSREGSHPLRSIPAFRFHGPRPSPAD